MALIQVKLTKGVVPDLKLTKSSQLKIMCCISTVVSYTVIRCILKNWSHILCYLQKLDFNVDIVVILVILHILLAVGYFK